MKILDILNNYSGWDKDYAAKVNDLFKKIDLSKAVILPQSPVESRNNEKYKFSYLHMRIKIDNVHTVYVITSETNLVGLGLGAEINLTDPALPYSDLQSQIRYSQGKWYIKDGGASCSTYGTWHKLQSSESVKLDNHQTIKLGSAVSLDFSYKN